MSTTKAVIIVAIVAVVTFITRALPFLIFRGNKIPKPVKYLGDVLPPTIIAILVVYCLKSVNVLSYPFGLPELIACAAVAVLHIIWRNNLLSIGAGTLIYMLLIQFVFI
jgi:branched-chain amino acid transport protein azlD